MSQCCGWNLYMAECIRYAVMYNNYGKHPFRFKHTFKEYPLYPHYYKGCKFIDVVGKNSYSDTIKSSVAIEIKSGWTDFKTGHGLNLYANWNFIAVEEGDFSRDLLYYMRKHYEEWESIGLLEVTSNGSVETLIPANSLYSPFGNHIYHIENHWEECINKADSSGNIEEYFQKNIVPIMKNDDEIRKIDRTKYPVELLTLNKEEERTLLLHTSKYLRENVLGYTA